MIYQIKKKSNCNYTLQLGGTERQIERLATYFNVKLSMPGLRHMCLNTTTRKEAQQKVDNIPIALAKVKRDISYVYEVNYYGDVDKEQFADCRHDVMLKQLSETTEEIIDLVSTNTSKPVVPKLIKNESWHGYDYQRKVWQIGDDKQIEFLKKPNDYFTFVKNRHRYFNVFN